MITKSGSATDLIVSAVDPGVGGKYLHTDMIMRKMLLTSVNAK